MSLSILPLYSGCAGEEPIMVYLKRSLGVNAPSISGRSSFRPCAEDSMAISLSVPSVNISSGMFVERPVAEAVYGY